MTPTRTRWRQVRRALADAARTHAEMWATLERLDPDPTPRLHWEPTTSGWRLHGSVAPPCEFRPPG